MDGIEPTPPAPAPAPTPAAAQQSDPSGGPLPPIHTMPMPPMPAVSAPPPAPATNTSDFNRPLTPPALQVSSAPPPPPQLPPITAFQYQQSPHQQSTPWQPIQISGLTPTSQPSSSSALTPSPTAPILAAVNPTSDPQQVTLPGPASLLNSNPPPSIAIPSITTIPSHSARQERKEPDHRQGQPKRRNRPAVSCIPCRARKIKCDQKKPCESCVKSKYHKGPCAYDQSRLPKEKTWPFKATQIDSRPPSPEPQPQPQQQEQQHLQSGTPDAIVNAEEGTSLPGPRYILDAPYRDSQSISSGAYGGGSASPLLPPIKNEPGASSAFSPIPRHAQHSGGPLPLSDAEGTEALRREVWMLRQQVDELTHQQQHQQQSQQQLPPRQRPLRESRPYSQNGASKTGDNRWHADQLVSTSPALLQHFASALPQRLSRLIYCLIL